MNKIQEHFCCSMIFSYFILPFGLPWNCIHFLLFFLSFIHLFILNSFIYLFISPFIHPLIHLSLQWIPKLMIISLFSIVSFSLCFFIHFSLPRFHVSAFHLASLFVMISVVTLDGKYKRSPFLTQFTINLINIKMLCFNRNLAHQYPELVDRLILLSCPHPM